MRKYLSSFAALNIVQFLSALNDNIFKLLLIFLLIHIQGAEKSNLILAIAGSVFVVPFLLFASLAGTMADRFSKRNIIVIIRFIEIAIMSAATIVIALESPIGGYIILFCMATLSAIFSPCKFGIIPEIVKKDQISHYNGILTATTYLAIIGGTFLASLLTDVTKRNFVLSSGVCIAIAITGALFSLGIEKTPPQGGEKKISMRLFSEIYRTLKKAQRIRYLFVTILFAGYFLFMGAYVQLNIIPFAIQSLSQTEIQGGYLFLLTAIGIGIGSYLSGRLSGKEVELGYVPIAAGGISFVLFFLYLFDSHFYIVAPLLILLGILGGFYIVPMDSFIQLASLSQDRGQNVASANFISFLGVIFASFLIGFLGAFLNLSAAFGFFVVALMTFIIAFLLLLMMADQVLRLVIARVAKYFWNIKIEGKKNYSNLPTLLLVAERKSWLDTIVMMAILPRLIRAIVPMEGKFIRSRSFIYRFLAILPVDREHIVTLGPKAIKLIRKELMLGHPVCLMQPPFKATANVKEWEESISKFVEKVGVPTLPIYIKRHPVSPDDSLFSQLGSLFKHPITVSFGSLAYAQIES